MSLMQMKAKILIKRLPKFSNSLGKKYFWAVVTQEWAEKYPVALSKIMIKSIF